MKHITRLRYKLDGLGHFGDKRPHLFIFPVDGSEPIRVTGGEFDYANACWAQDGRAVAYTACRHPNADDQRFTNPQGSRGYGQAFCGCIRGQWGDKDFRDCMAGVEAAVERADWIDPQRVGIAGGSYGGFMVNWALGHTDRFKAGVTTRRVVNRLSSFGTSDFGYRWDENLGCLPWENPMRYLEQSPWLYVANIHTPLLITHPEGDLRCPIDQGDQLYAALEKLGRTVEFVRYRDEFHGLSRSGKPWHRVHRLEQVVAWFVKYLGVAAREGANGAGA